MEERLALSKQDEALQILLIVRRRLLDRMGAVVIDNRDALLNGRADSNHPFSPVPQLVELNKQLAELDNVIGALAELPTVSAVVTDGSSGDLSVDSNVGDQMFDRFIALVKKDRLEAASRELAGTMKMSSDRVTTATRFFARCLKTDQAAAHRLSLLCEHLEDWTDANSVKALMKIFGFQAVEAQHALAALKTKKNVASDKAQKESPNLVLETR